MENFRKKMEIRKKMRIQENEYSEKKISVKLALENIGGNLEFKYIKF